MKYSPNSSPSSGEIMSVEDDFDPDELYEAEQEFYVSLDDLRFAVSSALTNASIPQDVAESLNAALEATNEAEQTVRAVKKTWVFYR